MPLEPGRKLGPYEILDPLGVGGMGEVYRARDTKLDREVAIKILPEELAADDKRVKRFEREARLLASLNHPNIASIHGFEDSEGVRALVLELVDGPTLAQRIRRGPLPVKEALAVANQIAEALVAGHDAGVIHRDLKPENIKLREDGTVKVLDYGIAKALGDVEAGATDSELKELATITSQGTAIGAVLGTAAYMSPEQALGKSVDRRADVWAFGAVVYEMLAGHRAFLGDDAAATLASVLGKEPAWEDLPPETPPAVRQVLRLCLSKDVSARVRDVADVRLAIAGAFAPSDGESSGASPVARSSALVAVAAVAAVVGALIATWPISSWGGRAPSSGPTTRLSVMLPANRPLPDGICFPCRGLAISPDGTQLAYVGENLDEAAGERGARWQLQLRSLATLGVRDLPGTSGATQPFFSPDGRWVAFFTGTGELEKVSLSGGNPIPLAEGLNGSRWGAGVWTEDGAIIFDAAAGGGLASVSAEGGETVVLTKLDESAGESSHRWPALVPGGRAVLFTVLSPKGGQIEAVMRDSGERRVIIENAGMPIVLASGHLVFQRDTAVLVAPFDLDQLSVSGAAVPLVDAVRFDNPARPVLAQLAVSGNGTLAYLPLADRLGTLGQVTRDGMFEALGLPPGHVETPRVASDGRSVAFVEARGGDSGAQVSTFGEGPRRDWENRGRFAGSPGTPRVAHWRSGNAGFAAGSSRGGWTVP